MKISTRQWVSIIHNTVKTNSAFSDVSPFLQHPKQMYVKLALQEIGRGNHTALLKQALVHVQAQQWDLTHVFRTVALNTNAVTTQAFFSFLCASPTPHMEQYVHALMTAAVRTNCVELLTNNCLAFGHVPQPHIVSYCTTAVKQQHIECLEWFSHHFGKTYDAAWATLINTAVLLARPNSFAWLFDHPPETLSQPQALGFAREVLVETKFGDLPLSSDQRLIVEKCLTLCTVEDLRKQLMSTLPAGMGVFAALEAFEEVEHHVRNRQQAQRLGENIGTPSLPSRVRKI